MHRIPGSPSYVQGEPGLEFVRERDDHVSLWKVVGRGRKRFKRTKPVSNASHWQIEAEGGVGGLFVDSSLQMCSSAVQNLQYLLHLVAVIRGRFL